MHHVKNWKEIANMPSCLYKLTTGNFVTNKTLFTTFQKSHWLKFARFSCNAESRCLSTRDFRRWSITILHDKQNISPSSVERTCQVLSCLIVSCQIGRKVGTCLLGWGNSGHFHKFFIASDFSKFYLVFNERNYILLKSRQLRLIFTPITPTNISHSDWLNWTKGMFVLHQ